MNKSFLLSLALLASLAQAAPDNNEARWFRYYDSKNQQVVSDSVTPDHVSHGYDELTSSMRLIRKVPAQRALTAAELATQRARREAEAQRSRDDKQLLRLYSNPADAERARNRQVDALQVRIDFNNSLIATARQRRSAEAQRAATFERQGKPVPGDIRLGIAEIDKQISAVQAELNTHKAEQAKIRAEFGTMIQRLSELTGKPVTPVPGATAATAPAPAAGAKP